jgi:predicted small secreted protein
MRRLIALAALVLLVATLGGCATFRGMGEDIKTLGQAIENKAK